MILVDTSVWIDHFRSQNEILIAHLEQNRVLGHSWVTGELAMGNLKDRDHILALLRSLPPLPLLEPGPLLDWVHANHLHGLGLGLVDAHILASCVTFQSAQLWTRDRRLGQAAENLGCRFVPLEQTEPPQRESKLP